MNEILPVRRQCHAPNNPLKTLANGKKADNFPPKASLQPSRPIQNAHFAIHISRKRPLLPPERVVGEESAAENRSGETKGIRTDGENEGEKKGETESTKERRGEETRR